MVNVNYSLQRLNETIKCTNGMRSEAVLMGSFIGCLLSTNIIGVQWNQSHQQMKPCVFATTYVHFVHIICRTNSQTLIASNVIKIDKVCWYYDCVRANWINRFCELVCIMIECRWTIEFVMIFIAKCYLLFLLLIELNHELNHAHSGTQSIAM